MFSSNNRSLFHLRWKDNWVKNQKVSKYYENDCRSLIFSIEYFFSILFSFLNLIFTLRSISLNIDTSPFKVFIFCFIVDFQRFLITVTILLFLQFLVYQLVFLWLYMLQLVYFLSFIISVTAILALSISFFPFPNSSFFIESFSVLNTSEIDLEDFLLHFFCFCIKLYGFFSHNIFIFSRRFLCFVDFSYSFNLFSLSNLFHCIFNLF